MAKKWIQGMDMKKGALTAQAEKAGMSIDQFCAQDGLSSTIKKRCVLKKTFSKFKK